MLTPDQILALDLSFFDSRPIGPFTMVAMQKLPGSYFNLEFYFEDDSLWIVHSNVDKWGFEIDPFESPMEYRMPKNWVHV